MGYAIRRGGTKIWGSSRDANAGADSDGWVKTDGSRYGGFVCAFAVSRIPPGFSNKIPPRELRTMLVYRKVGKLSGNMGTGIQTLV